jgi:hypothetical protein
MPDDLAAELRSMSGPNVPNVLTRAADEIERLTAERDEARREVCSLFECSVAYATQTGTMPFAVADSESLLNYAQARGWDCFKDYAE